MKSTTLIQPPGTLSGTLHGKVMDRGGRIGGNGMRTKDGAIRENPVRTDGYQMLANAIILQAVQDYRKAKRVLNTYRGDSQFGTPLGRTGQTIPTVRAEKTIRETERFFRSKWFQILSGVNPEYLIERLKEEDAE